MKVDRQRNGNIIVTVGIGDMVTVRGEDITVKLEDMNNTYTTPRSVDDMDEVIVTGRRRSEADYPPDDGSNE